LFKGSADTLASSREAVMDFLHEYFSSEQQEIDVLIALQEALANAVLHGCKNDPDKVVRCSVNVTPEAIELAVQDPGPGFDTIAVGDSSEDGTNLTQHGRGIMLIRSMMDEVSYRNHGSQLRMRKLR
jgi:serine/threonine-protein kinase RsbW